jgi:prepilin-type N-terminal cleavage/methylation domain-containing protein
MMITARSPFAGASVRRGFSLIELLLAIFILGVGIISVAAVFPAGIIQQRRTQDDVLGPVIAEAAMATIRSKVSQSDFGTFEEFGFIGAGALTNGFNAWLDSPFPNSWMDPADSQTQTGDWPWLRPAMAAVPNGQSPDAVGYAGDIDVFSARIARGSPFVPVDYSDGQWLPAWRTSEFARAGQIPLYGLTHPDNPAENQGLPDDPGAFLFGIPFNRARFDFFGFGEDPLVTITQGERFWPAGTGYGGELERPQYAWDCMFRRFQGRVQVAIFVYRVKAGNAVGGYAVAQDGGSLGQPPREVNRPPMPARIDLSDDIGFPPFSPFGADPANDCAPPADEPRDFNVVPGTCPDIDAPNNLISFDPYFEGWQSPGQWMLDPYGRIHRVLQGRRNKRQGPVRLTRPIPTQTPSPSLVNPANVADFDAWQEAVDEVRSIWFIPPNDRRGIGLEPIYVTVRDL